VFDQDCIDHLHRSIGNHTFNNILVNQEENNVIWNIVTFKCNNFYLFDQDFVIENLILYEQS
jgi:hypothetical protein